MRRCSRRKFQPTSISSTASSAERPRHGAPAACALSPLKSYSTETMPLPPLSPQPTLHLRADVREDADVDVLEDAGAHVVRLGAEQFLGHAGPELQRALQVLLLHDLLDRERGGDLQRHAGVVPFAVAGRTFDDRLVPGDARLLRRLRDVVDVGAERDHRLAAAPRRRPRRRNAGDALLNREAVLLEDRREVLRRLELLEPGLREAEHHVVHLLDVLAHRVDFHADVALELIGAGIRGGAAGAGGRGLLRGGSETVNAIATPINSSNRDVRMKASRECGDCSACMIDGHGRVSSRANPYKMVTS